MYKEIKNRVLFKLRDNLVVQQVLINTLLTKSHFVEELAQLLNVRILKIIQIRHGKGCLREDAALKLVHLFYQMNHCADLLKLNKQGSMQPAF